MRTLASRVGLIVGAASNCRNLQRPRVQNVVDKFAVVIKEASANEAERVDIIQQLDRSLGDGRRAMTNPEVECAQAERQFVDLERSIVTSALPDPGAISAAAPMSFAPAQPAPTPAAAAPSSAVHGVTDQEIRFGMVGPFSGPSKQLGRQMKLGIDTAFNRVNEAGGISGRMLRLIAADDGYEPSRTLAAMAQLYDKEQVFCYIGNVGTPTAAVAAPYALERRALFFGAFTGTPVLRHDPPDRYVFNYRAGLTEEIEASVRYLVKVRRLQPRQIAVFAQDDAFGEVAFGVVVKAMRILGASDDLALRLSYKRGSIDVNDALTTLATRKANNAIKAVIIVGSYRASAKLIEKTNDLYPGMIYTNISFVGSSELAEELKLLGPRYSNGVVVTQVVPAVDGYSSAILEYKASLAKYFPGEAPDYVSLEGYIGANIVIQALKQIGPQLDTERLVDSLESLRGVDMGLGTSLSFGRSDHQASHKVWGTALDESGKYQAIDLE
ncbi:MAG: ABC transporter substrate-binding protein [Tardiphaga sp.]|nr:ABC transporter substrate-binding protein [Tardiphaga sp.]MBC7580506.1 ABC transporter substrate-binding protein [Tardiphaga sp.]